MIVRGTATAANERHRVLLALPHRAHARSSDFERSGATNEGAGAECSNAPAWTAAQRQRSRRQVPPDTRALKLAPHARRRSYGANRRGNEGLFKTGDRDGRRGHVQHVSRTVPLTVKLRGRASTSDRRRGRRLSPGARGAKQTTPHGPLQRWLGAIGSAPEKPIVRRRHALVES